MRIKLKVDEIENKREIIFDVDEESAKWFLFSVAQILKSLISKNKSPFIAGLSSALINTQIKGFFHRWKGERVIEFPFVYKDKPGKVVLNMRQEINSVYEVKNGKEV